MKKMKFLVLFCGMAALFTCSNSLSAKTAGEKLDNAIDKTSENYKETKEYVKEKYNKNKDSLKEKYSQYKKDFKQKYNEALENAKSEEDN